MERIQAKVDSESAGTRLDQFLVRHSGLTRSRCVQLIEEGHAAIDGESVLKAGYRLKDAQEVVLDIPDARPAQVIAQDIPIAILYQDADIAVIDKPCGMVVHPAAGNEDGTLVNALLYHLDGLSGIGGELRPGIVHRLDKDTSGLLIVAKNDRAHLSLCEQFKARTMEKHYLAVALGRFSKESGRIDAPIARHPVDRKRMAVVADGRESHTEYRVIESLKGASYLDVHLLTGRTHQIRVHMQHIGHPLLGDAIYGAKHPTVKIPRLMLHAHTLRITHPSSGKIMEFCAPVPDDFLNVLQKLR